MSTITLHPNSDISNTNSISNQPTAWQALSDNLDTSSIFLQCFSVSDAYGTTVVGMQTPTQAGTSISSANINSVTLYIKYSSASSSSPNSFSAYVKNSASNNSLAGSMTVLSNASGIATFNVQYSPKGVAWVLSDFNDLRLEIDLDVTSDSTLNCLEAYIVVDYTVTTVTLPNIKPRVSGAIYSYNNGWARINGALRQIDSVWIRVNGVLKKV